MEELLGEKVKLVYQDGDYQKVVKGILKRIDNNTIEIKMNNGVMVIVGKSFLISLISITEEVSEV